ncbi:hypothetical protein TNCV_536001 [Trichonephila clavipes]|nr:hypothetical protein TNCV_536001 [Trichonephila clavipes]
MQIETHSPKQCTAVTLERTSHKTIISIAKCRIKQLAALALKTLQILEGKQAYLETDLAGFPIPFRPFSYTAPRSHYPQKIRKRHFKPLKHTKDFKPTGFM